MCYRYKRPAFFWNMFKRLDLDSCLHCFCPLFIIIERSWNKSDFWAHYRAKLQAFWSRKENASQKGSLLGASRIHHAAVWDYESKNVLGKNDCCPKVKEVVKKSFLLKTFRLGTANKRKHPIWKHTQNLDCVFCFNLTSLILMWKKDKRNLTKPVKEAGLKSCQHL